MYQVSNAWQIGRFLLGANGRVLTFGANHLESPFNWQGSSMYRWLVLVLVILSPVKGFDIRSYLGTKAPYPHSPVAKSDSPQWTVRQVHYIGRHGTRYPLESSIKRFIALEIWLKDQNVTLEPLVLFRNPYSVSDNGQLHPVGIQDMRLLAKRFQEKYYGLLLEATPSPVFVQASIKPRSIDSLLHFYESLFGERLPPTRVLMFNNTQDADLTPHRSCQLYVNTIGKGDEESHHLSDAFRAQRKRGDARETFLRIHFPSVASRLSRLYGITLTIEHIDTLMEFCAFGVSLHGSTEICSLFSEKDMNLWQISMDLESYARHGYGARVTQEMMCSLLTSISDGMDSFVAGSLNSSPIDLRFGHAETIMPFVSRLGLFKGLALKPRLSLDTLAHRSWITSQFSQFSANIMFELVERVLPTHEPMLGGTWAVRLRVNEIYTLIPGCSLDPCPLQDFQDIHSRSIGCAFDSQCRVTNGPTFGGWNGFGKGR